MITRIVRSSLCGFSGSFTQAFSQSCTHHFHDHAPTIFIIIHPPGSSLSSSLLPPWQSLAPFITGSRQHSFLALLSERGPISSSKLEKNLDGMAVDTCPTPSVFQRRA